MSYEDDALKIIRNIGKFHTGIAMNVQQGNVHKALKAQVFVSSVCYDSILFVAADMHSLVKLLAEKLEDDFEKELKA